MLIQIRTRVGPRHGWGNLYRLLSFARVMQSDVAADFRLLVEGSNLEQVVNPKSGTLVQLREDISLEEEEQILVQSPRADLTIIEMLDCDYEIQELYRRYSKKLCVFDDLLDKSYCADLVICGQQLPYYGNIEVSHPDTRFLTGYEFFIADKEFEKYREKAKKLNQSVTSCLVTLGGGAYELAYVKIARALAKMSGIEKLTFVLGPQLESRAEFDVRRDLPAANVVGGVENMDEMLWEHDLAIVSAGYLKIEAALTSTPAMMIATQWHQIPLGQQFATATQMPFLGYMGFISSGMVESSISTLLDKSTRQCMVDSYRGVVDSRGAERVWRKLKPLVLG